MESKLIGKKVIITAKDSWAFDQWGAVKMFDGDYYHIAIYNDPEGPVLIFTRDEFRVPRAQWG